jgi:DNA-binding CsgD family transcriptional regulator
MGLRVMTTELEQRFQRLTAREVRVLILLLEGQTSTRDIADVLGSTPGAVQTMRQTIRRKLAVPRNGDLAAFVDDLPALRDLATRPPEATSSRPVAERRRNLVLRSAVRDLAAAAERVRAKAGALTTLATDADGEEQQALLAEADLVDLIARELDDVRDRAVAIARSH